MRKQEQIIHVTVTGCGQTGPEINEYITDTSERLGVGCAVKGIMKMAG